MRTNDDKDYKTVDVMEENGREEEPKGVGKESIGREPPECRCDRPGVRSRGHREWGDVDGDPECLICAMKWGSWPKTVTRPISSLDNECMSRSGISTVLTKSVTSTERLNEIGVHERQALMQELCIEARTDEWRSGRHLRGCPVPIRRRAQFTDVVACSRNKGVIHPTDSDAGGALNVEHGDGCRGETCMGSGMHTRAHIANVKCCDCIGAHVDICNCRHAGSR